MLPTAVVTPGQGILPPGIGVSPHILIVVVRKLRPPLPALEANEEKEKSKSNLFVLNYRINKIIPHILHIHPGDIFKQK